MKKMILSLTLALSVFVIFCGSKQPNVAPKQTTDLWAALGATDYVTDAVLANAVSNGYFTAIATIPSDNTFVTKAGLASLICNDQTNTYYTALPYSTTFVTKQSVTSPDSNLSM
jgi:hypothetical protein